MTGIKNHEIKSEFQFINGILNFMFLMGLAMIGIIFPLQGFSETGDDEEELSVHLNVKGIGSSEIPALYRANEIYLSVIDVFDFLKIKNTYNETLDSVSGFLINEESRFTIDIVHNLIIYEGKQHRMLTGDLTRSDGKLYLKSNYFGSVFGLQCTFDFRNLSVNLNTDLELPVIREMRQELMRTNVNKLKGEEIADTTIRRNYPMAKFGMADWSVINTHTLNGANATRASLGLGAILAGGETNVALTYDSRVKLSPRQQYYLWRYVNNDNPVVRQVLVGKIQPGLTASVYSPAVGLQLTNTATTFRRSFGSYTLSNTTYPGWIVELYVNNVLISFVKADASGFYTFQVPLVYGNSSIKLRFYGPYGEERASEEFINIPFNFMPPREFEYNVSAGFLEDGFHTYTTSFNSGDTLVTGTVKGKANTLFSKAKFNYGINRFWTVGGGVEYLSSVESGDVMPFINTSFRILPTLMLTAEHTDKVVTKGMLSYRLPSNLQLELNYSVFDKNQTAIRHSYREQRKVILSFPFNGKNFSAYSRWSLDQIVLENSEYTTAEWMLSGSIRRVSANLSTYSLFINNVNPLLYSNLSLGIRLPHHFIITPQVQYEYTRNKLITMKCAIEKKIKKFGVMNAFYEENIQSRFHFFGVGFRMDFNFAQAGLLVVKSSHNTTFTENANGSFIFNTDQKKIYTSNRTSVGKGGLMIVPFLDLNYNEIRDDSEPEAAGLKMNINGGQLVNSGDTSFRVLELEPFTSYYLKFNENSFNNINWSLQHNSIKVMVDPNHLKRIDVPVTVSAEVSGMVYIEEKGKRKGQGKIVICIYNEKSVLVKRIMSEPDGYFSYLGLRPGNYIARIDVEQLANLNMESSPANFAFMVEVSENGDVIDDVEFVLIPRQPKENSIAAEKELLDIK